jgi:hypothetical protein
MATMPIYPHRSEASWFRPTELADVARSGAARGGRRGRQSAVKVLGWMCIAGFSAASGWMVSSTAAHDAIASWGTMGRVVQPRLVLTSLEGAPREGLVQAVAPTAQEMAPVPVKPSGAVAAIAPPVPAPQPSAALVAATEPSAPAPPRLRAAAPSHREAWQKKVSAMDDPYAGSTPRPQPVADNPYDP